MNYRIDLHMHTTASDGTYSPEEIVKAIKEEGIDIFSITDHDTIENISVIKKLAEKEGLNFIPGVEISTLYEEEIFHILAYNYEINDEFIEFLKNNSQLLSNKDDDSIKKLIENGFEIDFNEYIAYKYDKKRGGWKTLNFLIDKGICKNVEDFFGTIFTGNRKLVQPQFPCPKKAIDEIHKAGGKAVLAHPRYGKSKFSLKETLDMFKSWGIDGIECSHPNHKEDEIKEAIDYCKNNNLIITGGSDFHGKLITKRILGKPEFYVEKKDFLNKNS